VTACDHTSIGVLVPSDDGRYLLFERATFPPGIAPPAGHVDDHGTPAQAAVAEVREEVGLTVVSAQRVGEWWLPNRCRRDSGPWPHGHRWTIFRAHTTGDVAAAPREARNPGWYTPSDLGVLAYRTLYGGGLRLEPVWIVLLHRLGMVWLGDDDAAQALRLAGAAPGEVTS
jgi:8-oxo-dGTP pyrophosphatase MutT (NUDIX family)